MYERGRLKSNSTAHRQMAHIFIDVGRLLSFIQFLFRRKMEP